MSLNKNEIRCMIVCRNCKMASLIVFHPGTDSELASAILLQKMNEHNSTCQSEDIHEMHYFFN